MRNLFTVSIGLNPGSQYAGKVPHSQPEAIVTAAKLLRASSILGATIVPAWGVWNGELEPSIQVQILGDDCIAEDVAGFATLARGTFNQDCVLVTRTPVSGSVLVNRDTHPAEAADELGA